MNFLERLLRAIAGRKEKAIGLDIGSGSIKMAEVVIRGKKPFLKKTAMMELPEHVVQDGGIVNEELLSELIARMAAKNGFASRNVALALGGRSMFIRELVLPRMSEKELREAIHWDLDKYVPFTAEKLYFDFWIIGPGSTEVDLKILLVAVPKELVDALVRVLGKSGLKLAAIEIEPLAVQRTLPAAQDFMLIDIGAVVSQVTLFQKSFPAFTRSIPIGGVRFAEIKKNSTHQQQKKTETVKGKEETTKDAKKSSLAIFDMVEELDQIPDGANFEQILSELISEVRRTMEYYQVQNRNVVISQIFLTGGGALTENLPERLAKILEIPVSVNDPFVTMEIAASFNRRNLKDRGPQMAVAIGLAMRGLVE